MADETPEIYSSDILHLALVMGLSADVIGQTLGVSSTVILGALSEEFNDRNASYWELTTQLGADFLASEVYGRTHADFVADYQYAAAQTAEWRQEANKLVNPIFIDVGIGNIQIYTAIRLLNDYITSHPLNDPLGLKSFSTNYANLVHNLLIPNSDVSVKFAGLMVKEAMSWGQSHVTNWSTLSSQQKEAFAVFYYNVGRDFMDARHSTAIAESGAYNVDIDNTPIAQEYLMNRAAIIAANVSSAEWDIVREQIANGDWSECFLAGTPVVLADGSEIPIETVRVGDIVQSYDRAGKLVPARVVATSMNRVRIVLDLFGLMMTPGHVTLCGDGPFAHRHVPVIDILRSDGALVAEDGSLIRAATGARVGSEADRMIWAVTGRAGVEGFAVAEARQIRAGTRVLLPDGRDFALIDIIAANGRHITSDGQVAREGAAPAPFVWTFSDRLPRPEDHVLARSCVTLADIHNAAEWEGLGPQLPAPATAGIADLGPALPPRPAMVAAVTPNRPYALTAEDAGAPRGARRMIVQVCCAHTMPT
jgi:hypothetical protein